MASINTSLANDFVTMTANLQRLAESERLIVVGTLKQLEEDISAKLLANPNMSSWRKSRYNALLGQTKETIKTAYTTINNQALDYLTGVASIAAHNTGLAFGSLGLPLQSVALTTEQYKSLASNALIEGAPSSAWWSKQSTNLQESFVQQMRIGYASGESVDQLVRRVRGTATGKKNQYIVNGKKKWVNEFSGGIMDTGTRQAAALVRTSTQKIASDARLEMFKRNEDIIKGVTWVATLDMRTTELCAARDGKMWTIAGEPIPPNTLSWLGGPPAHWNCRSCLVPVTKSFEELGSTPGTDKEYLAQLGEGTRASMDGQMPTGMTFDSWFGQLSEADQVSFLGPGKYKAWKDYGLTFAEMINQQGNPLTLKQLADTYGFKLEQSMLTGQPNIPAVQQNALVVEQQIQAKASELAEEMAAKLAEEQAKALAEQAAIASAEQAKLEAEKQAALAALAAEKQIIRQAELDKKKLDLEAETKVNETKTTIASDLKTHSSTPDDPKYISAKQAEEAMSAAEDMATDPSEINNYFQQNLIILQDTSQTAKDQLLNVQLKQPFQAELYQEFIATKKNIPWWNYDEVAKQFDDFVKDKDFEASKAYIKLFKKPVEAKALTEALNQVQQGIPGSYQATLVKQKEIFKKLSVDNIAADDAMKALMVNDPEYQSIYTALKAKNKELTPVELKQVVDAAYGQAKNSNAATIANQAISNAAGNAPASGSIVQMAGKSYNLSIPKELTSFQAQKVKLLDGYKKNILAGKKTTANQKEAYNALAGDEKIAFDATLTSQANVSTPITSNMIPDPGVMEMSQMEKIGRQLGSNEGGFYRDRVTNQEFYVKFYDNEDIARNELLASKLYQAMGVDVPELTLIDDNSRIGIASKVIGNLKRVDADQLAIAGGVSENFAVDAWLGNWDVIGLDFDNLLVNGLGRGIRIDAGGALRYRAQGGLKGAAFGNDVLEFDTLRNSKMNRNSFEVFKNISEQDLEAGVKKVLDMDDQKIQDLVSRFGPLDKAASSDLVQTLIARRKYIEDKFPHLAKKTLATPAQGTTVNVSDAEFKSIEQSRINGFAIKADADLVEDQSVLSWVEKTAAGDKLVGIRLKYTNNIAEKITERLKRKTKRTFQGKESLVFTRIKPVYHQKTVLNGFATETNTPLDLVKKSDGQWKYVYEATVGDTRVRIWPNDADGGVALTNQIEVMTPGSDAASVNRAMRIIEDELGIPLGAPNQLVQEEMYLRMIARHRGKWDILDADDAMRSAGERPDIRVAKLKEELSKDYGQDITQVSGYNPEGTYEAFNTGQRRWHMPGSQDDADWKDLTENYRLMHGSSGNITDIVDRVLNGGGKMTTTSDKLRRGLNWGGMSPDEDMMTGGADYFFTRIIKSDSARMERVNSIFWKGSHLTRMDKISYDGDYYGRTTDDFVRQNAKTTVVEMKNASKEYDNETIFKGGLSLFDDLDYIGVADRDSAINLYHAFAKHGWFNTWVDGRPIWEVIKIAGKDSRSLIEPMVNALKTI